MLRSAAWALPIAFGVAQAVRGAWVCDDIFVSFRYVENWVRGAGLVFNPGERVEGYTHFLWVTALSALRLLGFDLVTLGRYLPIVAWAALLGLLFVNAVRLPVHGDARGRAPWLALPVAAWAVALHQDAQVYASSGLETALFGLLLLAGALTAARARLDLAAVAYALATLVRPEGMMYAGTAAAWALWCRRDAGALARFAGIFTALVAPFAIWKFFYYGTVIPNTYYAKSAGEPYWSQGWTYTRLYFTVYTVVALCIVIAFAGWIASLRRRAGGAAGGRDAGYDLAILALVQVGLTIVYVARVGGDFMFARFFIPVTPLAYVAAEEMVRRTRRPVLMVVFAAVAVGGTLAARQPRARIFHGCEQVYGITNEPNCYSVESIQGLRQQGEVVGELLNGTRARVALPPGRTMLAYFGQLQYAVEGSGLTDASIARLPLAKRGRPGHEKGPSDDWMRAHEVQFRILWGAHRSATDKPYERIRFRDVYGKIVYYDVALMDTLAGRQGIAFRDFRQYLDEYVDRQLSLRSPALLLDDYAAFQSFYFQHNHDPERLARLQAALRAAGVPASRL